MGSFKSFPVAIPIWIEGLNCVATIFFNVKAIMNFEGQVRRSQVPAHKNQQPFPAGWLVGQFSSFASSSSSGLECPKPPLRHSEAMQHICHNPTQTTKKDSVGRLLAQNPSFVLAQRTQLLDLSSYNQGCDWGQKKVSICFENSIRLATALTNTLRNPWTSNTWCWL